MNIIQQLKKNRYPFGAWPDPECYGPELGKEMQRVARGIGNDRFERFFARGNGTWKAVDMTNRVFLHDTAYRLRSDYEEKPEKVEVRIIRGDGYISPVSTSSISAHVKEFEGKKWVSVIALNEAVKSIANAEYWLKHLDVWGNSNTVQKIYKLIGLTKTGDEPEAEEQPEIVECEIHLRKPGNYLYCVLDGVETRLSKAIDNPCHDGFKFEGGMIRTDAIAYLPNGDYRGVHHRTEITGLRSGKIEILHATHVLFRRQK